MAAIAIPDEREAVAHAPGTDGRCEEVVDAAEREHEKLCRLESNESSPAESLQEVETPALKKDIGTVVRDGRRSREVNGRC
jgi:hypothetical protein